MTKISKIINSKNTTQIHGQIATVLEKWFIKNKGTIVQLSGPRCPLVPTVHFKYELNVMVQHGEAKVMQLMIVFV